MLAARSTWLLNQIEHVAEARAQVEEIVSVIANEIRRAKDERRRDPPTR
jgi:hypothetical protein